MSTTAKLALKDVSFYYGDEPALRHIDLQVLDEEILAIRNNVEITKRRRWFTTFITFRETYKSFYPFHAFPFTEHFTPEEIESIKESYTANFLKNFL